MTQLFSYYADCRLNLVGTLKIETLKIEDGSQHSEDGHDSSLLNVHANEGYRQGTCQQLNLDSITLFWTCAPGWACPLGAGTSDR